jgi:hypothetical protein
MLLKVRTNRGRVGGGFAPKHAGWHSHCPETWVNEKLGKQIDGGLNETKG